MRSGNLQRLKDITLAPYIQRATTLIGVPRKIGGNQFRHQMATMSILIDYKFDDPVMLKAALVHDLLEEKENDDNFGLASVDSDGPQVLALVQELTRPKGIDKEEYLKRLFETGSDKAKLIKLADRISNITDITTDIQDIDWIKAYIKQTEELILPYANELEPDMYHELSDAIEKKKRLISVFFHVRKLMQMFNPFNGN